MTQVRQHKLRKLAEEKDVSVFRLVDQAVQQHGTLRAAAEALGVRPMTIYQWAHRNGYAVETSSRLVKKQRTAQ